MFDLDAVRERLDNFGYVVKAEDESALNFCLEKVRNTVKNETNQPDVPEGLEHIAIDMVCGEFLNTKRIFAPDDLSSFDLDGAVKEIRTGDTTTVFSNESSQSDEQKLISFINYLLTYGLSQFNCYRKLRW